MIPPPDPMSTSAPETAAVTQPFTRPQLWILLGITLVAAVLRLFALGDWSLWIDEAHTLRDAVTDPEQFWSSSIRTYPLSYLYLRELMPLLGSTGEGWLRLPFTFFGILAVPSLALVGRLMIGPRAALLAALLLALSPWHLFWSQSARFYSLVLFFSLWGAGLFYVGVQRGSWWLVLAAIATTTLAGLCHPSAYLMLGAYGVYAALALGRRGTRLSKWAPLWLMLLLIVLTPAMLPLLEAVVRNKPDVSGVHLAQTTVWFVRMPLLIAAFGGVLWLMDRGEACGSYLLAWMSMPLLVLQFVSMFATQTTAQYAFYTLPAFCLAGAAFVEGLAAVIPTRGLRGLLLRSLPVAILLLELAGAGWLYYFRQHGDRPRWREAADYVTRQSPGPLWVVTTNGPSLVYYLDRDGLGRWHGDDHLPPRGHSERLASVLALDRWSFKELGGANYLELAIEHSKRAEVTLWVVVSEPELEQMPGGRTFGDAVRQRMLQVRYLPNWNGPKDMSVLVYRLPAD